MEVKPVRAGFRIPRMPEARVQAASKRMPKARRRRQLLATAFEIVRSEGTDALTLARLAERAGVTKPIAYEHFGTRAGLLAALYRDYEERQTRAMNAAIEAGGRTLDDVASIVSAAYVDCILSAGPACDAIAAALSAFEETKDFLQSSRDYNIAGTPQGFCPVREATAPARFGHPGGRARRRRRSVARRSGRPRVASRSGGRAVADHHRRPQDELSAFGSKRWAMMPLWPTGPRRERISGVP